MNAQQTALARDCLAGAYDNTLSFPRTVEALMEAGFDGYLVDYRCGARTYYLPSGDSLQLEDPRHEGPVAEGFDANGIVAAIRWAQGNAPDYTYAGFNARVAACGCAGYLVSFPGRRVVYFGRTGETHVEWFPGARP